MPLIEACTLCGTWLASSSKEDQMSLLQSTVP
jgi:hypothetical protein